MQQRLFGRHTRAWQYCLIGVANIILWPMCIVLCIILCPIQEPQRRKDPYINTRSCRHL